MWVNQSEIMSRTSSQFNNSQIRLTNYSSEMTHRKLKQVFNITYTHYCSTSIHKKLQDKCRQPSKKYYNMNIKDNKSSCFEIANEKKRSIVAGIPLKLKFITLNNQLQNAKNKRIQSKNGYLFTGKLQDSKIFTQEQFPLKATGYKVQLRHKQDPKKKSRNILNRPSTAHLSLLKSRERERVKRLKTTCDNHLQDKQQSDMRTVVKGWQLSQRQQIVIR